MSKSYITMHTDGSALGNPGQAGYGVTLRLRGHNKSFYGPLGHRTSNYAEIMAVIKGLEAIKGSQFITIYSDSQYVVFTMTKGWKRNANQDLWRQLDALVEKHKSVEFNWIPRQMNGEADKLAKKGAEENG